MKENIEKIVFLSRLPAKELALVAKQNPTDSLVDCVLTNRIKNLSYCLKDWFDSLPLKERQQIVLCISNGIEHPTSDFCEKLKQTSLPVYHTQTPGVQKMFFDVLEKFAILAPVNLNEEKRHFFSFYFKQLEHNALVDRLDEERRVMEIINPKPVNSLTKGRESYQQTKSPRPYTR